MTTKGSSTTRKTTGRNTAGDPAEDIDLAEIRKAFKLLRDELDQFTGYEEDLVFEAFGHDVWDTYDSALGGGGTRALMRLARMIAFAHRLREGEQAGPAFEAVQAMRSDEVDKILEPSDEDESGKEPSDAA